LKTKLLAKRFGLQQGEKVRFIDDCTIGGFNGTCGLGSVSAFLRISMAVWFLGIRGLRLCWISFFDDFTVLSKRLSSNSAAIASESLFNLLGIQFARDGKKAVDWDTTVKTLGVQFNLRPSEQKGVVLLGHTESRIEELKNVLNSFWNQVS
jgi:hypothetical protein